LLDTNIVSFWFNEKKNPEHARLVRHIEALPGGTPLRISAITLGEIEYGYRTLHTQNTALEAGFNQFVREQLPEVLRVQETTKTYYGSLRAQLFERYVPKKGKKALRLVQLTDPITDQRLGIQENDLWIAAQAIEYNRVLVTHDRMQHLQEVKSDLKIEDWAI
jgi:predicted nucleic acid-binding protein